MENTSNSIIYAVNSDLDDGLLYAEFENKDAALDYAKQHLDKLPFVDELEVSYDANGEIDNVFSYKTIWDHTMPDQEAEAATADATVVDSTSAEDAYWDFRGAQEIEAEKNKYDIGDTTWFESMDNLVEEMEKNEDMVECKECFDLFPKTDCIKVDLGYVCPTCHNNGNVFTVSDNEVFNVDFPEYEKFSDDNNPEFVNEPEMDQIQPEVVEVENEPISKPEEAVPFLVNDEVEAVAGYEKAAEVVANSDLENKEEILDVIEHIKEEEEEHIEELQDLMDDEIVEVENDPISDEAKEVEETAVDVEEPEVLVEDTNSETRYWMCFYDGSDVTVIEATDEDDAMEKFESSYNDEYFFDSWDHDWSVEEISKEEYDEWETSNRLFSRIKVTEHVNKDCPPIESDQKLEGTDNAVVDCKVADVVTHSEDEKPVDCEGKKKPLENPLTEGFIFSLNNEKDLNEFTQLCQEVGIKTIVDLNRFTKETAEESGTILDKLRSYRKELDADFQIKEAVNRYNFTKEEQEEYNMDEDGNSLDSYDTYVRCSWCNEIFTKDQCVFEANMGWLCDRCQAAIISRGEKLTLITNPTEEDEARIVTENIKTKLTESDEEVEPLSKDPAEKPSKDVKMADTASTAGMDFEDACKTFGIALED